MQIPLPLSKRVLCFENFLPPWGARVRPWEGGRGVGFRAHRILGLNPSSAAFRCVALGMPLNLFGF